MRDGRLRHAAHCEHLARRPPGLARRARRQHRQRQHGALHRPGGLPGDVRRPGPARGRGCRRRGLRPVQRRGPLGESHRTARSRTPTATSGCPTPTCPPR
ncbi:hypothetical protein [Nocardioides convexus]|uniref:hypothetical protein n=1 Tax=Nocardioides convexus TaxID=2712224 RepID=UPI0024181877|nr:hypothetical protein [Nocardioides convexus]